LEYFGRGVFGLEIGQKRGQTKRSNSCLLSVSKRTRSLLLLAGLGRATPKCLFSGSKKNTDRVMMAGQKSSLQTKSCNVLFQQNFLRLNLIVQQAAKFLDVSTCTRGPRGRVRSAVCDQSSGSTLQKYESLLSVLVLSFLWISVLHAC
jgi:hypothetical protein